MAKTHTHWPSRTLKTALRHRILKHLRLWLPWNPKFPRLWIPFLRKFTVPPTPKSSARLRRGSDSHHLALRTSLLHSHGLLLSDQNPAHFVNRPVAMIDQHFLSSFSTLSQLFSRPPEDRILIRLDLALCLLLTTRTLTTWIACHLSSRPKMSTHLVPQHAWSHVASALNSHLTSKPSTDITQYSSHSTQVQRLA